MTMIGLNLVWLQPTDVNAAYEFFINRFLKIYDEKFTITHKRTRLIFKIA